MARSLTFGSRHRAAARWWAHHSRSRTGAKRRRALTGRVRRHHAAGPRTRSLHDSNPASIDGNEGAEDAERALESRGRNTGERIDVGVIVRVEVVVHRAYDDGRRVVRRERRIAVELLDGAVQRDR